MRSLVIAVLVTMSVWTTEAPAQQADVDPCAQTEAWVITAVKARIAGHTQRNVHRVLSPEMGEDASKQLLDFVYALPRAQLRPELGSVARAQCEQL